MEEMKMTIILGIILGISGTVALIFVLIFVFWIWQLVLYSLPILISLGIMISGILLTLREATLISGIYIGISILCLIFSYKFVKKEYSDSIADLFKFSSIRNYIVNTMKTAIRGLFPTKNQGKSEKPRYSTFKAM